MLTTSRLPQRASCSDGQRPVVIAVAIVPVVQSPINKMISVITMRYVLMLAVLVVAATIDWSTGRRICLVYCKYVFVVMVVVNRVEMPVVLVVVVVTMRDAHVATRLTVDVGMTGMGFMTWHYTPPSLWGETARVSGNLNLSGDGSA